MAAQLPWQFFSASLTNSSNSLISNSNLISKIYFPRLIIPAGSVITSFVDFLITAALVAVLMGCFHFMPDWRLLTLPLFAALAFAAAFGAGLWLSALNVEYRDFRYVVPFIVSLGIFVSPVGFTSASVPTLCRWHGFDLPARLLYSLNPMVGVIDGFRWALLRGNVGVNKAMMATGLWWPSLLLSCCIIFLLCLSGIWYFRRMERTFADVI